MSLQADNNKRIAKNTLLLYFRMLLLIVINLYTSRVILNALGVEDFGIYNVVGGVVAMFSILSSSLSSAISRFITYELGNNNSHKIAQIFSASVTIQILLSIIIAILIESVGLWFLNNKMTIPEHRIFAANCVLQFSIITFIINLISIPYNAAIIAHEKMSAFAYISIVEAIGKLSIAYLVIVSPIDKLIFYSILMCIIAVIIRFIYGSYCKKNFVECTYHFEWNTKILKEMFSFAGWNFIGSAAGILRSQGISILLNIYFGPIVNAAQGIATQVNNAISGFSSNFLVAVNPQIIKSYSQNDLERSYSIAMYAGRFAFFLLIVFSVPIIIETRFILELWLKSVPEFSIRFIQLTLILTIIESISLPIITLQQATGRIRNYQIIVGSIHMLNFPISLILLHIGLQPNIVYIVAIFLACINTHTRLYMLKRTINVSVITFYKEVLLRLLYVSVPLSIFILLLKQLHLPALINIPCSIILVILIVLIIGIKREELKYIISKLKRKR